jgi:predicted ATPase
MLKTFRAEGFKSLIDLEPIEMAPLTVFFGPNAAGKSNLLDALLLLSRLATARTVAEAVDGPVRGLPLEIFSFREGEGLPGLLDQDKTSCRLEADLVDTRSAKVEGSRDRQYRYQVEVAMAPASGTLTIEDEYLAPLTSGGKLAGKPVIELADGKLRIRRRTKPAHPWEEEVGLNHAIISNKRFSGKEYAAIENARRILTSFRSYYLDPRSAMRLPQPPRDVDDIGPLGEHIAPFLYRLRAEHPKVFRAVRRTLCALIPSVDDLDIDLDERRGVLSLEITQEKTPFSARIVSEGTLRVLALICVATNPWGGSLVAFEEPENGVHPRRIELIAEILGALALEASPRQQVILTTHSPLLCSSLMKLARKHPDGVRMYRTVREGSSTRFLPLAWGPLFKDQEIQQALTTPAEDSVFEGLLLRGLLDG